MPSRIPCYVVLVLFALMTPRGVCGQAVSASVTVEQGAVESFHTALCGYYGVPRADVVVTKAKKISDENIPVVFLIAKKASVTPEAVAAMRLSGKSWMDITLHFRLTAEVFHVEFARNAGPPYGKAWGHFKNRPRGEWGHIHLADDDVVQLVNVKFLAERCGCTPEAVISLREKGESFISLAFKLEKAKGGSGQGSGPGGQHRSCDPPRSRGTSAGGPQGAGRRKGSGEG